MSARIPNNLPFSNTSGEGIENRIAEVFGKALGLPVTYYSFPQRLAFIRNTLRYKLPGQDYPCDIVMGVPVGFDQVSVTKPYYRSTYALVFAAGKGLDHVKSSADFLRLDKPSSSCASASTTAHRPPNGSAGTIWSTAACPTR